MTDDKLNTSLSANTIMAIVTNHVCNIIDWQTLFTWLWRWLPLRLSQQQSVTNNSSFQNYLHPDDHTIRTNNLVLSTGLMTWVGHCKEIGKLAFRAFALRGSELIWNVWLWFKTSFLNRFMKSVCDWETINSCSSLAKLLRRFPKITFDPRIDLQIYIGRDPKNSDNELKTSESLEDHRLFPG